MTQCTLITVGTLKEKYLSEALDEYKKRIGAFAKWEEINLKESKLPEDPSPSQIAAALDAEGETMKPYLTPRAYKIALCVEGKQFSSEQLAARIDEVSARASEICLVIGSSHGI